MFARRLSAATLAPFCRSLRQLLEAGMPAGQAMGKLSTLGPGAARSLAGRLAVRLGQGQEVAAAMAAEKERLPALFVALVAVGEETGKLPEVLQELEAYFDQQRELRRKFWGQLAWPAFQFVFAVLLLAGLITVLGVVSPSGGANAIRLFGLQGGRDALVFLAAVAGGMLLPTALIARLCRRTGGVPWLDRLLLRVPLLGSALHALAVSRFSFSLALTLDAGVPIARAMRLSLESTSNAAFAAEAERCAGILERGGTLEKSLRAHGRFDDLFVSVLSTAEIAGSEPPTLRAQAEQRRQTAAAKLRGLATVAGVLAWAAVAAFIISAIFQIFSSYVGMIDSMVR